jgi:hypothetical protein
MMAVEREEDGAHSAGAEAPHDLVPARAPADEPRLCGHDSTMRSGCNRPVSVRHRSDTSDRIRTAELRCGDVDQALTAM